jgi:membrane AbrB-like protein
MLPLLKSLVIALPAGVLTDLAGGPLPWVIGPLLACAFANLLGLGLHMPRAARNAGQWAIGVVMGLYFTPPVLAQLVALAPWIGLGIGYAFVLGLAFAWVLRRYAGVSRPTAFFAGAIGGASEMASQGERHGGRVEAIAAVHALRIVIVVVSVPFAYQWLDLHGSDPYETAGRWVSYPGLAALVAVTSVGAVVLRRLGAPSAWVLGPLAVTLALTASGQQWSELPRWMLIGGQVLIGASLGTRFTPDFFSQAPRLLGVVAAATVVGMVVSAGFGSAVAWFAGIPFATMVLATSPGGIAEMTLTAKNLRLGVPVVTAFHVTRMVATVVGIGTLYRLLGRWRGWT